MGTMRHVRRISFARRRLGAGALFLLGLLACNTQTENSEECVPGDFQAISLSDGGSGFLRCSNDGGGYEEYDGSNPNTPPDANVPDAGACMVGTGQVGYFCACTQQSDCVSGLDCTPFVNKVGGSICTPECTTATAQICTAPSMGCGNNGHCKP
jgi:hypothetical protein